jgi:hypothetical protein
MDSLPLNDSSGYDKHATYTGTPTTARPIVAGGIAAQLLNAGDAVDYNNINRIMISGRKARAFTLEAWIKASSGTTKVIARDNSGLFIDGLKLRFTIDRAGTLVSAEYKNLRAGNVYHVAAVYDTEGISLFLNGVKVADADIEPATAALDFADVTTKLTSSTTSTLVLDTVAVYNYALGETEIRGHYEFEIGRASCRERV